MERFRMIELSKKEKFKLKMKDAYHKMSIKNSIASIERSKQSIVHYIVFFFFASTLRYYLELFSDPNSAGISTTFYSHYLLFYVSLAPSLILAIYWITKENIVYISKLVLTCFFIVVLPPIFDLIISGGKGLNIAYLRPELTSNLWNKFITFTGKFTGEGITYGIKIEIGIVLLGSFIYFYTKTSSLIKTILGTLLIYTVIFFHISAPFFLRAILNIFKLDYEYSPQLMADFLLLLSFLFGLAVFYNIDRNKYILILKDIRPLRLLHFFLMFILGLVLGSNVNVQNFSTAQIFDLIFTLISIIFAWLYSVVTNNIEDIEIDKISNPNRPLVKRGIDLKEYKPLSWVFLSLAFIFAGFVNFTTFFIISLFVANYFIYSLPPLKTKRIPVLSKIAISINSLALFSLGYMFFGRSIYDLPGWIYALYLIGFTLCINVIDIKDYKGDKVAGINTLPVLVGERLAKLIISTFFVCGYIFASLLFGNDLFFYLALVFAVLQFFFINKRKYEESYVLAIYLISIILVIIRIYSENILMVKGG